MRRHIRIKLDQLRRRPRAPPACPAGLEAPSLASRGHRGPLAARARSAPVLERSSEHLGYGQSHAHECNAVAHLNHFSIPITLEGLRGRPRPLMRASHFVPGHLFYMWHIAAAILVALILLGLRIGIGAFPTGRTRRPVLITSYSSHTISNWHRACISLLVGHAIASCCH